MLEVGPAVQHPRIVRGRAFWLQARQNYLQGLAKIILATVFASEYVQSTSCRRGSSCELDHASGFGNEWVPKPFPVWNTH